MYFPGTLLETCIPESGTLQKVLLVNWPSCFANGGMKMACKDPLDWLVPYLGQWGLLLFRLETIQWLLSKKFQIKRVHSVIGSFNLNLCTTHTTDTYLNSVHFEVLYHTYYWYLLEQCDITNICCIDHVFLVNFWRKSLYKSMKAEK